MILSIRSNSGVIKLYTSRGTHNRGKKFNFKTEQKMAQWQTIIMINNTRHREISNFHNKLLTKW